MIRVLVVDDDPDILFLMTRWLKDACYDSVGVMSGQAALEQLERENFCALVTDLMMPGMNGIELLEKVKGSGKPLKTIMATAYPMELKRMGDCKPDRILHKPFGLSDIVKTLKEIGCEPASG